MRTRDCPGDTPHLRRSGPKIDEYRDLITGTHLAAAHQELGYISAEDCIAFGITGPVLRASAIQWDLRKKQPYSSYEDFEFDIQSARQGHLRPLCGSRRGDAAVDPHHSPGGGRIDGRADYRARPKVIKPPLASLCQHRGSEGRTRLFPGERRHGTAVPVRVVHPRSSTCRL